MANVKISALPAATALVGPELVPVVQGGVTSRSTASAFVTLASGVIVPLSVAAAIAAIVPVTNANMASMAEATVKGRAVGAGSGVPQDLTQTQLTALVNPFTDLLPGAAPASGGGTANFLRADATWAAPPSAAGGFTLIGTAQAGGSGSTLSFPDVDFETGDAFVFEGGTTLSVADILNFVLTIGTTSPLVITIPTGVNGVGQAVTQVQWRATVICLDSGTRTFMGSLAAVSDEAFNGINFNSAARSVGQTVIGGTGAVEFDMTSNTGGSIQDAYAFLYRMRTS